MRELPRRTQILIAVGTILCLATFVFLNQGGTHHSEIELLPDALSTRQLSAYEIAFADAGLADYRIEKTKDPCAQNKEIGFHGRFVQSELIDGSFRQIP